MSNANKRAYPRPYSENTFYEIPQEREAQDGLTKRELFAAMAMQALIQSPRASVSLNGEDVAFEAVTYANALIAELEKKS